MAFLPETRIRATDANGVPLVGATLTIYTAGTTTPALVYRDSGMAVPMTNPTSGADVSDSGGYFPQIFAIEGLLFDVTLKDEFGATIETQQDVPTLGSGSAVFLRDFGNSRAQITGSAGVVRYEAGPATGDDTGGQLTLGGFNGSQADAIVLDALTINTTGALTEKGKALTAVVYSTGGVITSAEMIIPLPNDPLGTLAWDIDLIGVDTGGTNLEVQISVDNGATYLSGAFYTGVRINNASASTQTGGTSKTLADLSGQGALDARMRVMTTNTTGQTRFFLTGVGSTVGSLLSASGLYTATVARATHIRLFPGSGAITGGWRVMPLRGL